VHDPAKSSPSSPDPPPRSPLSGPAPDPDANAVGYEEAFDIVGTVIAWYSRQVILARRAGEQERLDELMAQRRKCVEDQHRLRDAGSEEIARIAAEYTARLSELEAAERQDES